MPNEDEEIDDDDEEEDKEDDEEPISKKKKPPSVVKNKIKKVTVEKSPHRITLPKSRKPRVEHFKIQVDQANTSNNEPSDSDLLAQFNKPRFKHITIRYVGDKSNDTIDKNKTIPEKEKAVPDKDKTIPISNSDDQTEKKQVPKPAAKSVRILTLDEIEERRKLQEQRKLEEIKKQVKKKKEIDLNKRPSNMEDIFASLDEESSEEEKVENDDEWEEMHLALFSPYEVTCRVCDLKLNSHEKLLHHIKKDHGSVETSTLCDRCGYTNKNIRSLQKHRQEHSENLATKKMCDICAAEVLHLSAHKRQAHRITHANPPKKRDTNDTPSRPDANKTRPQLSSTSTHPSYHGELTSAPSVPTIAANSNLAIPNFDGRQYQRSMMEMSHNSSNIPTNVPFAAVFNAAHKYYYR